MNKEEKQAIKYFYNLRATIDESNMLFDEDINIKCGKEMIKQITTVLNLLEKKDKQLEERTNRIKNLEKECQNCFDAMMDTINENNFKNEIIVEMAKLIFNHRCDFEWYEAGTDIDDIKQQIEYFKNEVKRRMENE